jgi:flagellar biosynthesis protein FlhA
MIHTAVLNNLRDAGKGSLLIPVFLMVLLAMMTLQVPPFLLDVLFSFNITLAIVVLLVGVYSLRPLDFAVFPTVLLVATLLRLALNVASTRVVLLYGHEGGDAAGKVIQSFGEVVIGGNYVVGLVVFLILIIINFVVVTKGAGRISEVSARFTLDSMPGKQMAIDADLNAGMINQEEAKARRIEVASEADFYGAMDGASKFVRGDAVAGLLILVINLIGGLSIGMLQHDLDFSTAMRNYSLLTIGDGLVAQIPGLLLSTAAAILVTRVNSENEIGKQVASQMFTSPKALAVAACILIVMGVIPGMPHVAFIGLGLLAGGAAYWIAHNREVKVIEQSAARQELVTKEPAEPARELSWDDVMPVDMIGLEVGYRLIPLVDKNQGGQLLGRIKGVRKKLSQELGFLMPTVHIRDNLELLPNYYRVTLMGVTLAEAEIHPDRDLAINPGQVFGSLEGIPGKDPAFGLEAVWIDPGQKEYAQTQGYTVVDASTVIATHLNHVMHKHAHELLGHEEVQQLIDVLAKVSPKLAEELVPNLLPHSTLLKVLQNLLIEQVPIRDIRSIAEAMAEVAPKSQDPNMLTSVARIALARSIVQAIAPNEHELQVITLDPALEQLLMKSVQQAQQMGDVGDGSAVLEPSLAERLQRSIVSAAEKQEMAGKAPVLLVAGPVRPLLARFVRFGLQNVHVLAYQEIPDNRQVTIVATVGRE